MALLYEDRYYSCSSSNKIYVVLTKKLFGSNNNYVVLTKTIWF